VAQRALAKAERECGKGITEARVEVMSKSRLCVDALASKCSIVPVDRSIPSFRSLSQRTFDQLSRQLGLTDFRSSASELSSQHLQRRV